MYIKEAMSSMGNRGNLNNTRLHTNTHTYIIVAFKCSISDKCN